MSKGSAELERLTEAVDRLLVRLKSLRTERTQLLSRVRELERRLEVPADVDGAAVGDPEAVNVLRIHSARLLRERSEVRRRLAGVLGKLENLQQHGVDQK
jgi:predicted  nucleic acid-binding Zn-ribbon protein